MIQKIPLFQAVKKTDEVLNMPIKACEKTWLGEGYYFWEYHKENARHWGKTHYKGHYTIYKSSYVNNSQGLDFVDNYNHREHLFKAITKFERRVKSLEEEHSYFLHQLIEFIISKEKRSIAYIRIDTGSFYNQKYEILPVPERPKLLRCRLVQVCFPIFPSPQIKLSSYTKVEDEVLIG